MNPPGASAARTSATSVEKLGPHGDAIETVRGVGYRLRSGWTEPS